MNLEEKKRIVVDALEDVKGKDITVLDVAKLTSMAELLIIASGESNRQNRALADRVQEKLREHGERELGIEGGESGEWILLDLGDIIVHLMQPAVRQYYNLEPLWGGQPYVSMRPAYSPLSAAES